MEGTEVKLPERYWDTVQQRWIYPGEESLPPLPPKGYGNDGWSEADMREYARQAVLQERERVAASVTPSDEEQPINHDEALELAYMKRETSNLARCYIALREGHAPEDTP